MAVGWCCSLLWGSQTPEKAQKHSGVWLFTKLWLPPINWHLKQNGSPACIVGKDFLLWGISEWNCKGHVVLLSSLRACSHFTEWWSPKAEGGAVNRPLGKKKMRDGQVDWTIPRKMAVGTRLLLLVYPCPWTGPPRPFSTFQWCCELEANKQKIWSLDFHSIWHTLVLVSLYLIWSFTILIVTYSSGDLSASRVDCIWQRFSNPLLTDGWNKDRQNHCLSLFCLAFRLPGLKLWWDRSQLLLSVP